MEIEIKSVTFETEHKQKHFEAFRFWHPMLAYDVKVGPGCFSLVLTTFRLKVLPVLRQVDTTSGTLKVDATYETLSKMQRTLSQYRQDRDQERKLIDAAVEALAAYENRLCILGDALLENDDWITAKVIEKLSSNKKYGVMVPSPAVINANHPDSPRLCQAWFWVPPQAVPTAVLKRSSFYSFQHYLDNVNKEIFTRFGYFPRYGESSYNPWYLKNLFRRRELSKKKEV